MSLNIDECSEIIKEWTIPVFEVNDQRVAPFRWLSQTIRDGKAPLKINSVEFIIANIMDRNRKVYKFERKYSFDLYVIGSFRTHFTPAQKVSETLVDFYLEFNILPIIHTIPKIMILENEKYFSKNLKGGVLIYERG